jgi:hypothetical protein
MSFDPMRGPSALAQGTSGTLRIGGLRAGYLTKWRVVMSPTTGKPTLFGEGKIGRYYTQAIGGTARAELTPAPIPRRIGRPTPRTPAPFVLQGTIAELTGKTITISNGEIARD